MADEFSVIVIKRKSREFLYLRYLDPVDGKRRERCSGTTNMKAALRAAAEWEAELNASGAASPEFMRWEQFREDFTEHYLRHHSKGYALNVEGSLNVVEQVMNPDTVSRITEKWLTRFHSLAMKRGNSSYTVRKYFQHLQTALKWAKEQGLIRAVPTFPKLSKQTQRGRKLMKGRPITGEEFERMLDAVDKTLESPSMKFLLRGLWLSGLRLGEALRLTWDEWADGIRVRIDDDGDVCLMIDAENQKNRKALVYPVVDDFAEFLLSVSESGRHGFVFNVCGANGKESRRVDTVSNWIVDIGKAAGVKVDERDGVEKFASAHDIRRAFGTRWAKVVPSGILQQLMRHSSIETTMKFYVNITAKDTLAEVRRHLQKHRQVNENPSEVNNEVNRGSESPETTKRRKP